MRPTVLLLMRNGVRRGLLRSVMAGGEWRGVRPATQGCGEIDHALHLARLYRPRVVVVDAEGFDGDGLHLVLKLRSEYADAKVIFIARQVTQPLCLMAHQAGARAIYGPGDDAVVLDRIQQLLEESMPARTMSGRVHDLIDRDVSSGDSSSRH